MIGLPSAKAALQALATEGALDLPGLEELSGEASARIAISAAHCAQRHGPSASPLLLEALRAAAVALLDPSEEKLENAFLVEQRVRASLTSAPDQVGVGALTSAGHAVEGAWLAFRPLMSTSTVRSSLRAACRAVEDSLLGGGPWEMEAALQARNVVYGSVRADVGAWALGYHDVLLSPPFLTPGEE